MTKRLQDHANWGYLLQEVRRVYRTTSSGGSARVRGHRQTVGRALDSVRRDNPPVCFPEPSELPVCVHLDRVLDNARLATLAGFARVVERLRHRLAWRYGYEHVPQELADRYAYCELIGPRGPVVTEAIIIGLVLFAPRCTYPQHSHQGITESYVAVSGAFSENDTGVYAPGSIILNGPGEAHRITTGVTDPCLLLYAWTGAPARLRDDDLIFD